MIINATFKLIIVLLLIFAFIGKKIIGYNLGLTVLKLL